MTARIQLRRGNTEVWTSIDPVLAVGEVGLNSDNNLLKIGDGSRTWTSLLYVGDGNPSVISSIPSNTIDLTLGSEDSIYYVGYATANWTLNLTYSNDATLDSVLSVGQSMKATVMVSQGYTPYYNRRVTVDGSSASVTTAWQGGIQPFEGNQYNIDRYDYTIIKTAPGAFTVFAKFDTYGPINSTKITGNNWICQTSAAFDKIQVYGSNIYLGSSGTAIARIIDDGQSLSVDYSEGINYPYDGPNQGPDYNDMVVNTETGDSFSTSMNTSSTGDPSGGGSYISRHLTKLDSSGYFAWNNTLSFSTYFDPSDIWDRTSGIDVRGGQVYVGTSFTHVDSPYVTSESFGYMAIDQGTGNVTSITQVITASNSYVDGGDTYGYTYSMVPTNLSIDQGGNVNISGLSFGDMVVPGDRRLCLGFSKFDSDGNNAWFKQYFPAGQPEVLDVFDSCVDQYSESYHVGYYSYGYPDLTYFLVKLDANGDLIYACEVSNEANAMVAVSYDSEGNAYVLTDQSDIMKIDTSGTRVWARKLTQSDYSNWVLTDIQVVGSDMYVLAWEGIAKLPTDGSLTGTYSIKDVDVIYATSTVTVSPITFDETRSPGTSPYVPGVPLDVFHPDTTINSIATGLAAVTIG